MYEVRRGDCLVVMRDIPDNSVDSCVTDPPYHLTSIVKRYGKTSLDGEGTNERRAASRADGLARLSRGFMGQIWDGGDLAFQPELWAEVLRVLKPGAHLVAFGGTRTYHRMACAIEDAGFEIRDQIGWTYGSGFPKSHNQPGGKGTALKPAWEPICMARKNLDGTVAQNIAKWGTGALNIDDCRIGTEVRYAAFTSLAPCHGNKLGADGTAGLHRGTQGEPQRYEGRWPANLIHDGSDEVLALFPDSKGQLAPVSTHPELRKTQNVYGAMRRGNGRGSEASADRRYADKGATNFALFPGARRNDSGSAARFFYCAKASRKDRGEGNVHPTVKPTDLMRYLCRLVTPPRGIVLDPFTGSGSTGLGALLCDFDFIGIEKDDGYANIADRRLSALSDELGLNYV